MNQLFYGDNLPVMRESLDKETVDLIYLDPPFNSQRGYNLLFKTPKGQDSEAQIEAFQDTWHWGKEAELEFHDILRQGNSALALLMNSLRSFLGDNDVMAYLTMMASRLIELKRLLKPSGSLYLHCDPTASHYLKMVLDGIFGIQNFRNEIIWERTSSHNDSKKWAAVHDTIFFYSKSDECVWNPVFTRHGEKYVADFYRFKDERGVYRLDHIIRSASMGPRPNLAYEYKGYTPQWGWRTIREKVEALDKDGRIEWSKSGRPYLKRYLNEQKGTPIKSVITDIPPIGAQAQERLGYPTQKPQALLERIISASSNEGDLVLDPFCGCGTAVHAAQKMNRKWIGIDITCLAISLIEGRLKKAFGPACEFEVHGLPKDLESAKDLARRDKYQFQWWAVSLVEAQPFQGKKKGADTGIDGLKFFQDIDQKEARKIIVSVKGGENLKLDDIRSLMAVRDREGAEFGLLISLAEPTTIMIAEAASAGFYESPNGKKYARVQLLTIEGLLNKTHRAEHPDYEPDLNFKKPKAESMTNQQGLKI